MKHRQDRIRACFKKYGIDAFIVYDANKVRYLTRLHVAAKEDAICFITKRKNYIITTCIHEEQANKETEDVNIIIPNNIKLPHLIGGIIEILKSNKLIKNIGVEGDTDFQSISLMKKHLQKEPICCYNLVEQIAIIKDKDEIKKIQDAIKLTEKVFGEHIIPLIKPGITENELAAWISFYGKKYGAEGDAFPIIAVSGKRSSLIHGRATNKKICKGDIVQFDFGYVIDGYPSDFSRVVFVGKPTKKQRRIYEIVREAQELALRAVKPGMACRELDAMARNYIKGQGYDLPHALGHGLGIKLHSAPTVRPHSKEILKPGHVITIEPGIYIPGWGGIRIEDVIVITKTGAKNLTSFNKDIVVV